jgi:hypothetical protein
VSVVTSDGIMLFNVFSAANSETRHFPANPMDSNDHNRLDGYGGSAIGGIRLKITLIACVLQVSSWEKSSFTTRRSPKWFNRSV